MAEQTMTAEKKRTPVVMKMIYGIGRAFARNKYVTAVIGTAAAIAICGAVTDPKTMVDLCCGAIAGTSFIAALSGVINMIVWADTLSMERPSVKLSLMSCAVCLTCAAGASLGLYDFSKRDAANIPSRVAADKANMDKIAASVCAGRTFDEATDTFQGVNANSWSANPIDETRQLGFQLVGRDGSKIIVRLMTRNTAQKPTNELKAFTCDSRGGYTVNDYK